MIVLEKWRVLAICAAHVLRIITTTDTPAKPFWTTI
jgi:hypothetical protein